MTHVFISYKREDEPRVGRIARALEAAGIEVWWDRGLPAGESWHAMIEAKLDSAGCVVVAWSPGAVAPEGHFVRDEARRGLAKGLLVPVLIETIKAIPLGFGETQAIDLRHWKGDPKDPFFQDLVATVRAKLVAAPPPRPTGPTARLARRLLYSGVSSAGLAAIAVFAFNAFGVASKVCATPGPQPGLSDACGAVGMGARPTRDERIAWAAIPRGSCVGLRAHIARFPEGAYRREAADLITGRRVGYETIWTPVTRALPQFVPAEGPAAPDAEAAKARALARGRPDAARLCRGFGSGTLYRFVAATPTASAWTCESRGGGVVCAYDGQAVCGLEVRSQVEREVCGPRHEGLAARRRDGGRRARGERDRPVALGLRHLPRDHRPRRRGRGG